VKEKYRIKDDELVAVSFTQTSSQSIEALKKALQGKRLQEKEVFAIMKDISQNRFTDILTTYYSALGFFYPAKDEDLYRMAKAMAET
jgi:thymidine phosphorylase